MKRRSDGWTENEDAILRTMWLDGKGANTIALSLGTRNDQAIWKRVKRLGLKRGKRLKDLSAQTHKESAKGIKQARQPLKKYYPIEGNGVKMVDLRENDCRWPLEYKLFCGLKCTGTYCTFHENIAFQKVKKRHNIPSNSPLQNVYFI